MRPRLLRSALATLTATVAAATCLTTTPASAAAPADTACSPSVTIEGYSDALDKTTHDGVYVGNISALAVDRRGTLAALSDRSALFSLDGRTRAPRSVLPLADENGAALDSEGLAVDRDGTYLISTEGEPAVRRYSRDGAILARLPVPDALRVTPAGRATPNGTFEGLTLLPNGRTLIAAMEYALTGDTPGTVRLQTWRRTAPKGAFALGPQYAYRTDTGLGVPEITALPDGRLLVLERGFTAGTGNTVRLYLADPRRATDTSGVDHIVGGSGVRPITKTLLADLADCPDLGAPAHQPQVNPLLDNIEAMTVTGVRPDRLEVLLASDDNERATQITRLYELTVRVRR
ncbi:esterase-like activity of phytase family protein [Streptomyces sp. NPDC093252]|uniref:esterase-like activity of phytase family protein n=1 Tax=Streptomyces sp. NPDC093252 TaxID=3154980 RepID=UPI0034182BEE